MTNAIPRTALGALVFAAVALGALEPAAAYVEGHATPNQAMVLSDPMPAGNVLYGVLGVPDGTATLNVVYSNVEYWRFLRGTCQRGSTAETRTRLYGASTATVRCPIVNEAIVEAFGSLDSTIY